MNHTSDSGFVKCIIASHPGIMEMAYRITDPGRVEIFNFLLAKSYEQGKLIKAGER